MYNKWNVDLSDSVKALESIKHTVLPKIISGKLHTIEEQDNDILMIMDTKSGIDYIREDETGLQGIAARVQWGNNWNTFTIRSRRHTGTKTELEKRRKQIQKGYFYPAFTLQAYFDNRRNNNLLSIAIIKTLDLYKFIDDNPGKVGNNSSDNDFVFVRWDSLNKLIRRFEG